MLLLPLAHHVDRHVRRRVAVVDDLEKLLIDRVAGRRQGALVLFRRVAALHDAEVARPGADVDDHRVQEGVEAVGDGERLADDEEAIDDALHGVAEVLLVRAQRRGGHTDNGPHPAGVDLAVRGDADEA